MKKNVLRILAAVLALTMLFSLAACGGKGSESSSQPSSSESSSSDTGSSESSAADSSEESSSEESSESSAADGKYATVKAFIEDPAVKADLDKSIETMLGGNDTMSVSLDGTDDTLIYLFTFSEEAMATTDEESLKTALADGLEEESFVSTFEQIAGSVATVVEASNVKVKVVYAKADGTELASREYTAK